MQVPYSDKVRQIVSSRTEASDNLMIALIDGNEQNGKYIVSKVSENKTVVLRRIDIASIRKANQQKTSKSSRFSFGKFMFSIFG